MVPRLMTGLASALCLAALAQTTVQAKAATAPVAYVYVSAGGAVYAYAAAENGTLTAIGSQTTPNHAIWHLSVTKKFLYGIDGQSDIYMYSIGPHGAITQIGFLDVADYDPDNCFASGVLQVDESGSDVYDTVGDCDGNSYLVSFKILPTGELLYLGKAPANGSAISQIRFTDNNVYAFQTGCETNTGTAETAEYKRESNGFLTYLDTLDDAPENSGIKSFCPFTLASHGDYLAFEYLRYWPGVGFYGSGYPLGVYTVSAEGKLSTKSDYTNMATAEVYPRTISISPSGAVLAVGGDEGYQFFHFNGASQPVKWTGPFAADNDVLELGWDTADHFYALTASSLYEYRVTATSYKQEAGLPNAFTNAGSVIVLSLN